MKPIPLHRPKRRPVGEPANPHRADVAGAVQAARRLEGMPDDDQLGWCPPTPLDELRKKMKLRQDPAVRARARELMKQGHDEAEARSIAVDEILESDRLPPGTAQFAADYLSPEPQPRQKLEYRFPTQLSIRRGTR